LSFKPLNIEVQKLFAALKFLNLAVCFVLLFILMSGLVMFSAV